MAGDRDVAASLHALENRILRAVGLAVPIVFTLIALAWFIFVRGPSPAAVCERLSTLAGEAGGAREVDAGALLDEIDRRCLENEERRRRLNGRLDYNTRARCILAAPTLEHAERC